ncbi:saccharopine dehydrogenase [Tropicimonas sp. IMCC6043]|uniref:saccharopine dehydrogenase n=1 Tax=Tropicimonas sp. IMCC6043 TaxID=2510645 RepID=UPI00101CB4F9|nr:saccharopine dehydrogenase [Tropicimonas sp. IMCC6043]RYH09646.1 saccharopine dehydrogenase [Tropicimonas sp. IMCC6043]
MTHLWVRAEERPNEQRVGILAEGVARLLAGGMHVTVEENPARALPIAPYAEAGADIAAAGSWRTAPEDAIIFGLKELPLDGRPLHHRHIMFGHAYKGQADGRRLLEQFKAGGGILYDLEYLVDEEGRRVAAFGYWAGYAGAAVALKCWAAQQRGGICGPVGVCSGQTALLRDLGAELDAIGPGRPDALIIGAKGRVGTGAADLCAEMGVARTLWDLAETAHGGPFPEVLEHALFLNCILARPGTPVFVPAEATTAPRRLSVIGDISCDPTSDFSPVKVYDRVTDWERPALRVHEDPVLDVTAIDNLPSMLPAESSADFAAQLLPSLAALDRLEEGLWARARAEFDRHVAKI